MTPKGYLVSVLVSWMAFRRASGEGCVSAVRIPKNAMETEESATIYN